MNQFSSRFETLTAQQNAARPREARSAVLVLDDDIVFGRVLQYQLRVYGFDCILCATSQHMNEVLVSGVIPDVFVLDYFLEGDTETGFDICRKLKANYRRPVMLLSGNKDTEIIVDCLRTGADQYVTKPCDIREVIARIEAALRANTAQSRRRSRNQVLKIHGELTLHRPSRSLTCRESARCVTLTEKEAALLEAFARAANYSLGRFEAFRDIYGYDMPPMNRSLDMLISRLRTRLKTVNACFSISTLRNEGYELVKRRHT